jgi:hypothetical protein
LVVGIVAIVFIYGGGFIAAVRYHCFDLVSR